MWTDGFDSVPIGAARDLVAELESLGIEAIWIPEMVGRDPFVHLAMLLSATEKMIG
ncbi:MAG: LLM class flavin-dependent oxidoreductase, partial [Comamonadaceae bacterium]